MCIPDDWDTVDLIKQTSSLMNSSNNSSLADELLFVRKTQAIIEFCMECKSLLRAFKLELKSDGELALQECVEPFGWGLQYLVSRGVV